jgi:hypothetical protein
MLPAARFGEDAVLLHALVEALERTFEGFVVADNDFSQVLKSPTSLREHARRAGTQGFTVASVRAIGYWAVGRQPIGHRPKLEGRVLGLPHFFEQGASDAESGGEL